MKRSALLTVPHGAPTPFALAVRPWSRLLGLLAKVAEWHRIRTEIAELRKLDDHTLRDIGIHPGDLEEAVRSGSRFGRGRDRA